MRPSLIRHHVNGNCELGTDVARCAGNVIASAVARILVQEGWTVDAAPGAAVTFRRDGLELRPFEVMNALAKGEAAPADWENLHTAAAVSDRPLS